MLRPSLLNAENARRISFEDTHYSIKLIKST